jgi:hypothetical protein
LQQRILSGHRHRQVQRQDWHWLPIVHLAASYGSVRSSAQPVPAIHARAGVGTPC